jgi:hypothetical protein
MVILVQQRQPKIKMTSLHKQIRDKVEELETVKQELYELKNTVQDDVLLLNEGEEMVTVIRKITSFEEVVMTKNEFDNFNNSLKDGDFDKLDEVVENMKDIWYDTNGIAPDQFTAFNGDVTDHTDDMLYAAFPVWTDSDKCDTGIKLFKECV